MGIIYRKNEKEIEFNKDIYIYMSHSKANTIIFLICIVLHMKLFHMYFLIWPHNYPMR